MDREVVLKRYNCSNKLYSLVRTDLTRRSEDTADLSHCRFCTLGFLS